METSNRSWTKARLVRMLCTAVLLIGTLMLSGCGPSGPDEEMLRQDMSESLSQEYHFLSLTDYQVVQSKTEDRSYSATIAVDASAESGYAEFDMLATVEYTKYDQGWDCDSCTWERKDWHVIAVPDEYDMPDLINNRYNTFSNDNNGFTHANLDDYTILPPGNPWADEPIGSTDENEDISTFICSGRSECWDKYELYHYQYDAKCYWLYNPDEDRFNYEYDEFLGNGKLIIYDRARVEGEVQNWRDNSQFMFKRTFTAESVTIEISDMDGNVLDTITLNLVQPDPNDSSAFFWNENAHQELLFSSLDGTKKFYLRPPEDEDHISSEEYVDETYRFKYSTFRNNE